MCIRDSYSTYASGGTAAVLSKQKPLSYEELIQEFVRRVQAVSYTHLDVYKRQHQFIAKASGMLHGAKLRSYIQK